MVKDETTWWHQRTVCLFPPTAALNLLKSFTVFCGSSSYRNVMFLPPWGYYQVIINDLTDLL